MSEEENTTPENTEATESEESAAEAKDSNAETILVAEDSVPNRKILCHLLVKLGYEVVDCQDGKEAWDKIEAGECGNLVAIISDIMMPNEDGLELLKRVRGKGELKELPFVLVTAVSEKEYIMEAKKLEVNGYILKPVSFAKVTKKLGELFPEKKFPKMAG